MSFDLSNLAGRGTQILFLDKPGISLAQELAQKVFKKLTSWLLCTTIFPWFASTVTTATSCTYLKKPLNSTIIEETAKIIPKTNVKVSRLTPLKTWHFGNSKKSLSEGLNEL